LCEAENEYKINHVTLHGSAEPDDYQNFVDRTQCAFDFTLEYLQIDNSFYGSEKRDPGPAVASIFT
jgi:hypothetical protein